MKSNKFITLFIIFTIIALLTLCSSIYALFSLPEMSSKYNYKSSIDLSTKDYNDYVLNSFYLQNTKDLSFTIITKGINTKYIDIKLLNSNNKASSLLHAETLFTNRNEIVIKQSLNKGFYKIVLNSKKSKGKLLSLIKIEE